MKLLSFLSSRDKKDKVRIPIIWEHDIIHLLYIFQTPSPIILEGGEIVEQDALVDKPKQKKVCYFVLVIDIHAHYFQSINTSNKTKFVSLC